ncbi:MULTISPECIES: DUF4232 domain-containing protein [unclassified Streptomyces]|uniref:DUF4232 domain-containing protein n=1 Tax=unclassified Streptomyces TaxID=2593676 RepID=UPI002E1E3AA7|nr:DUF4232 domain-containing protein [Streptomyces sp. NBC_01023]
MRVRKLTFAALAVAAGLSLTACNGDGGTAQSDGSSTSSESSVTSSTGGSGSGTSGSGGSEQGGGKNATGKSSGEQGTDAKTGSGTNAKVGKCRTDDLDITASDSTIGGDSEGSVTVGFKNGGQDCALSGYAGIDLKTNYGKVSAKRSGQASSPMVLKSGESVYFGISYPLNNTGGSGVKVTGLVVTPPDETKSFSLAWPGAASLPVTDGSGSPVKVGPMGSAGQGGAS